MLNKPIRLAELACQIGATLVGLTPQDADKPVVGVATLVHAGGDEVSFYTNRAYREALADTQAAAVILKAEDHEHCRVPALLMDNPYLGYARAAALFNPPTPKEPGIHPSAWVSPAAQLGVGVSVGPQAVIEAGVVLGRNVVVGPATVLEANVQVGDDSYLHARVTLCRESRLGCRVVVHPGAVIGADGFGLANDRGTWVKIPQLGGVVLGDEVEVGANTTIDRGALGDTVIETGVKLDNLIQIAHNVHIGAHTAIAGCVGIAGSTRIGARCMIAGGVGIVGHIEIVDDVQITGGSIVLQSILTPGVYSSGSPLQTNRQWHRNYLRSKELDKLARRLTQLEMRMRT